MTRSSTTSSPPTPSSCGDDAEVLDLRGEVCPFTFVRTKLRLEEMTAGSRLIVVVDHEPATRNVPRSARAWGQEIEGVREREPGVWEIVVVAQGAGQGA